MNTQEMKSEAIAKIKHNQIPLNTFESINDTKYRTEFLNHVFKKENFTTKQSQNLKLHFALIDYFESISKFKFLGLILAVCGIIYLIFAMISSPLNFDNSILTTLEGLVIFLSFQKNSTVSKYAFMASLIFTFLCIIEIPSFGLPTEIIQNHSLQVLRSKGETIVAIINSYSPHIYLTLKIIILVYLYLIIYQVRKFELFKQNFESVKI